MKKLLLFIVALIISMNIWAQVDTTQKVPTGWKFGGALPAIGYDSDLGFRYGVLAYVFDWGTGYMYPDYVRSIYAEWSRTTKGNGLNIVQYDDRAFFGSKVRFYAEAAYITEQALDFYGFNGYQARYHSEFEDNKSSDFRSRMFYNIDRRELRGVANFQIPVYENKLRVFAGLNFSNIDVGSVDIEKLNKGKSGDKLHPSQDTVPGLYENYLKWGVISNDEAQGGLASFIRLGLIYDTRNNEAWATKGMFTELNLIGNAGIGGYDKFLKISVTHRQYFTLVPKKLFLAYRLAADAVIAGNVPFYLRPYYYNTKEVRDAIGGSKTVRGMLRDKVVGKSTLFGNFELRWRILDSKLFRQNFYIALSSYLDGVSVLQPYSINIDNVPLDVKNVYFNMNETELRKPHLTYGGGLRLGVNENFIVAIDYGKSVSKRDGTWALYIAMGWLF